MRRNANKICPWCHRPLTLQPSEYTAIRESLGMTQDEIAAKLGITKSHFSYLETGRRYPSPALLAKIIRLRATRKARKRRK